MDDAPVYRVALDGWMVDSGQYPDFHVGQRTRFALELHPDRERPVGPSGPGDPSLTYAGRSSDYLATGRVLCTGEPFVLDAGMRGWCMAAPSPALRGARPGDWVSGPVRVSVDCFHWREIHGLEPGAPPLMYDWRVDVVEIDRTPHLRLEPDDPRWPDWMPAGEPYALRLDDQEVYEPIASTAEVDDVARYGYRLHCTRLGGPHPVR